MKLAQEIVSIYHSPQAADAAQAEFIQVFQNKDLPDEMPEYRLKPGETVLDVLVESGLVASRSEARRLLAQNGVRFNGSLLDESVHELSGEGVLQVGKRRYVRVVQ
jgi:tyrosyl-tRNA synthetase